MKAMAHIGVIRALEQAGIGISEIVAVSAGALVGSLYASGMPYERMVEFVTRIDGRDIAELNRAALVFRGVGATSLLKPEPLRSLLAGTLPPSGFDALRIPLRIPVTDLDTGMSEVFGARGNTEASLADVVYASMALPPYLPPLSIGGRTYADGGLLHVLPLELVDDADLVVASDVGPVHAAHPAWRSLAPALVALMDRSLSLMMAEQKARMIAEWRANPARAPMILVEPPVNPYGTFSFDRTVDSMEAGYRAAHHALREVARGDPR